MEHCFTPTNDMGITFGYIVNRIFARKIPMDRPLSFIEFRMVNFMAEHQCGLLEHMAYLTKRYDFPESWVRQLPPIGKLLSNMIECGYQR